MLVVRVHQEPPTFFKQLLSSIKVFHLCKNETSNFFCIWLMFRGALGLPNFDLRGETCI